MNSIHHPDLTGCSKKYFSTNYAKKLLVTADRQSKNHITGYT